MGWATRLHIMYREHEKMKSILMFDDIQEVDSILSHSSRIRDG